MIESIVSFCFISFDQRRVLPMRVEELFVVENVKTFFHPSPLLPRIPATLCHAIAPFTRALVFGSWSSLSFFFPCHGRISSRQTTLQARPSSPSAARPPPHPSQRPEQADPQEQANRARFVVRTFLVRGWRLCLARDDPAALLVRVALMAPFLTAKSPHHLREQAEQRHMMLGSVLEMDARERRA